MHFRTFLKSILVTLSCTQPGVASSPACRANHAHTSPFPHFRPPAALPADLKAAVALKEVAACLAVEPAPAATPLLSISTVNPASQAMH
jgi:hypothetical protein